VRNVQVARAGVIANESRRAARHVGAKNRRGLLQADRPPGPAVRGNEALMSLHTLSPRQKFVDRLAFRRRQLLKVDGQVDDAAQVGDGVEIRTSGKQLAAFGDRREKKPRRQLGRVFAGDPHRIASGDLAAVHTEQLAKLNLAGAYRHGRAHKHGPARRRFDCAPIDTAPCGQGCKLVEGVDGSHGELMRATADAKTCDRAGGERA
jgi:hypothetical protein